MDFRESPLAEGLKPHTNITVLGGTRESFGRGLETPIPHHCAWRDPKVLWPRVRNSTPSLCWRDPRVLWPRVRNPNTHHCACGTRESIGRGLETQYLLSVLGGTRESICRGLETQYPITVLGGTRKSFGRGLETPTPSLCLAGPESTFAEG
ncbi:Hypothetical protein FKW44_008352 [Caligus rogercresseyi]|uniref:Uncharacterized protein n=1 Tax=Caligus rogercresseyi TaxID=217165 RepID=A0A7T8KG01_CALRO|nr:Hypothetical protein FKW44_008352 [Caligus rogercresseyi]